MAKQIPQSTFYQVDSLDKRLPHGVVVKNLDLAVLSNETLRSELHSLWIQEGLIVFEGLYGDDAQLALSSVFGKCIRHPVREANEEGLRPGLVNIEYRPQDGWLTRVDGELRGQWLPWHSDLIYVDRINHGGILRPVLLPSRLGATGFIDKISAYALLPERLKTRIDGLHVTYRFDLDSEHQKFGREHRVESIRFPPETQRILARAHEFPTVVHPLVYRQQETGRPILNVSPWFAVGITELPGTEGDALLHEVVGYAIDRRNAYYHTWRMGQMVLWDNWRMLHSSTGAPPQERRRLIRTVIDGDYGLGRLENPAATNVAEYISI